MKNSSDAEEGCAVSVSAGSTLRGGAAAPPAAAAAAAAAVAADGHYWEDDVFRGQEPGKRIR